MLFQDPETFILAQNKSKHSSAKIGCRKSGKVKLMIIEGSAPPTPSHDNASSSSQRPAVQPRVLADVTNTSASLLAARDPNGAKRRGRKPGQKNFEKFSDLPARAKSTRRRSTPVPADHAVTAFASSIPRPARPVVAAAQPATDFWRLKADGRR